MSSDIGNEQKHGIPALLSFLVPGLGQLIKGQVFKAIGIWAALFVSGLMVFILIGFLLVPIIFVWQIYDAYNN